MASEFKETRMPNAKPRKTASKRTSPRPLVRSTASTWIGAGDYYAEDVQLPSGNVALVRRVGPEAFLDNGIIPDPLMPLIMKAIETKKGLPPKIERDLAKDPESLKTTMQLMNNVLCYAVVDPPVAQPPDDPAERQSGVLYADMVDLQDKAFILNFSLGGGTRDLERFREQYGKRVARVSAG
jgi:hypothetical protein